jgi:outer membrane lipoprotein-sorting protein
MFDNSLFNRFANDMIGRPFKIIMEGDSITVYDKDYRLVYFRVDKNNFNKTNLMNIAKKLIQESTEISDSLRDSNNMLFNLINSVANRGIRISNILDDENN